MIKTSSRNVTGFFVLNFLKLLHIKINRLFMSNTEHGTGHPHTNDTRKQFNNKIEKLAILGKSKKVAWDGKRRNRSI